MSRISRRDVLSKSIQGMAAGAAVAALRGAPTGAADSAADKVVLALVGSGGRGHELAMGVSGGQNVEFKYVCDVDTTRGGRTAVELEKLQGKAPQRIGDMRQALNDKDVHGVIVATPDHWHALATIWACQAGKDVYVEKNLALSIWEGRQMVAAARKHKRIVQAGFQNRSGAYGASAREYIRSGKLGSVACVHVYNMIRSAPWKAQPDTAAPAGLDWDRWIGPAPMVPYNTGRHHGWYFWYDYCNGDLGNDASHQLDLLRLVLGDPPAPRHAYCAGGNHAWKSGRQTPEVQEATFEYPDCIVTCTSSTFTPYMRKSNREERFGTKFPVWWQNCERIEIYGSERLMYLGRQGVGWQVMEADGKVVAEDKGLNPDKAHLANFIDCIRTRKDPNAVIEQAHQSAILTHMANIAHRNGNRRVEFDSAAERFVDNDAANRLLRPGFRQPYAVPEVV